METSKTGRFFCVFLGEVTTMKKIFCALLIIILSSCIRKEKCIMPPIPNNVCNINDLTEDKIVFHSGKDTATLSLIDKWDDYEEESITAIANKVDCRHSIGYECTFQDEHITVNLTKDDKEDLALGLFSGFNTEQSEIATNEEQILNKDKFIYKEDRYNSTIIKQVVLKGIIIESITTKDNKIWKP